MTIGSQHRAVTHRSAVPGIEAFSLTSDRSFPRHAHDHFGIGHVEAGAGDMITVNPGEMHDGDPVQGRTRAWRMLYLDPGVVARALSDDLQGDAEIARPVLDDPFLRNHFARAFASLTTRVPDTFHADESVVRLLAHLMTCHGSRRLPTSDHPPPVAQALRRIVDLPEQPITLAELAALSGVSRFQLLRGFARTVGTTPHAYLLQQRVRLARRLLAAGHYPAEAAADAGFADQSHLTRAFQRQLGVTPARYRAAVV